jgi:hypothetical protein
VTRFRIPFLTLTALALAIALVAWDAPRRAAASIEAQRRELEVRAEDPARSRAALFDRPSPGNAWDTYEAAIGKLDLQSINAIPEARSRFAMLRPVADRLRVALHQAWNPPADPGELAETAAKAADALAVLADLLAVDGRDRDAMDVLLAGFGLSQDFLRISDVDKAAWHFMTLGRGAVAGLRALDGHALRTEDLAPLCGTLDRLDRSLRSLGEAFERSRVVWKKKAFEEVLLEDGLTKYYTWKDWSSRTLFTARILEEIDRHHFANAERGRRPPWKRVRPAPHADGEHAVVAQFYREFFCCIPDMAFENEVFALEKRALLRVALALAWHQAETGKPPGTLQDLVPRHLPALPVSPLDGQPFTFVDGTLGSRDSKGKPLRWPVQHR